MFEVSDTIAVLGTWDDHVAIVAAPTIGSGLLEGRCKVIAREAQGCHNVGLGVKDWYEVSFYEVGF